MKDLSVEDCMQLYENGLEVYVNDGYINRIARDGDDDVEENIKKILKIK